MFSKGEIKLYTKDRTRYSEKRELSTHLALKRRSEPPKDKDFIYYGIDGIRNQKINNSSSTVPGETTDQNIKSKRVTIAQKYEIDQSLKDKAQKSNNTTDHKQLRREQPSDSQFSDIPSSPSTIKRRPKVKEKAPRTKSLYELEMEESFLCTIDVSDKPLEEIVKTKDFSILLNQPMKTQINPTFSQIQNDEKSIPKKIQKENLAESQELANKIILHKEGSQNQQSSTSNSNQKNQETTSNAGTFII